MTEELPTVRMEKTVSYLKADLAKLRTSRVHTEMLDHITVLCYGQDMALSQLSTIHLAGPRQIMVSPWDQTNLAAIEKAIRDSDLNLNPSVDSGVIRIDMPELSGERRVELVKVVKKEGENARIAVRHIRRDELQSGKQQVKESKLSEDDYRRLEQSLQKATDESIVKIDKLIEEKSKELTTI